MRKWRIILSLLSIISLYNCSDNNKNLKVIDLQKFSKNKTVALEERYNEYFTEYKAVFLEKTDSFSQKDVKQIISIENDVFILIKNQIRRYNLITGHLDNRFQTQNSIYEFISFDIDTVNKKVYALDAKSTKIISLDTLGNSYDELKLDSKYEYDQLVLLDKSHILITTCSLPVPVTFVADLGDKSIKQIDHPSKKSFTPDKQLYDTIYKMYDTIYKKIAPINICSRSDSGVLVKYLFDDIVYKFNNEAKEPEFIVKINKANKPKLIKKHIPSKLGQIVLSGLWQLSEDKWLLRWSKKMKYKGSLTSIQIFTICNNQMGVYNDSMSYNTTIMEWYKPGTVFSIGAYDQIYVNTKEKKLFKVMSNNLSGIKLPEYLNDYEPKSNLLICYYVVK